MSSPYPFLSGALATCVVLALAAPRSRAQQVSRDSSPHRERMIAVAPGVRLAVEDWGGAGPPLVFLAGLGDTPHRFDDFAPRFRNTHHVYGITRRGFGASSRPDSGYDAGTRARDIIAVLDRVGIRRAILVGHSIAGDELTKVATAYPSRVRALVYLDAYDFPQGVTPGGEAAPPPQADVPMTAADSLSLRGVQRWMRRTSGVRIPRGELLATATFRGDGHLVGLSSPASDSAEARVLRGTEGGDYRRIRAPALAIWSPVKSAERYFPNIATFDSVNRAMARSYAASANAWKTAIQDRFAAQVRGATVLRLADANHYVFDSNRAEVERAMRAFLARVARQRRGSP